MVKCSIPTNKDLLIKKVSLSYIGDIMTLKQIFNRIFLKKFDKEEEKKAIIIPISAILISIIFIGIGTVLPEKIFDIILNISSIIIFIAIIYALYLLQKIKKKYGKIHIQKHYFILVHIYYLLLVYLE